MLACNLQHVEIQEGAFRFNGVSVNAACAHPYSTLASAIARAMPGLWGLCGVDFIETDAGPVVIEVNPRLTTSYAGLHRALGLNPARLVLELPASLEARRDKELEIRLAEITAHAR